MKLRGYNVISSMLLIKNISRWKIETVDMTRIREATVQIKDVPFIDVDSAPGSIKLDLSYDDKAAANVPEYVEMVKTIAECVNKLASLQDAAIRRLAIKDAGEIMAKVHA